MPYEVKQWELGNEIFGNWVRGHVTADVYANSAVRYAKAMRTVDPTIKLIAVGEGVMVGQDEWNSAVLRIAGPPYASVALRLDTVTVAVLSWLEAGQLVHVRPQP